MGRVGGGGVRCPFTFEEKREGERDRAGDTGKKER